GRWDGRHPADARRRRDLRGHTAAGRRLTALAALRGEVRGEGCRERVDRRFVLAAVEREGDEHRRRDGEDDAQIEDRVEDDHGLERHWLLLCGSLSGGSRLAHAPEPSLAAT